MKGFDQILHELESGKISAQQAKEFIGMLLNSQRECSAHEGYGDMAYQNAIDCIFIRFNIKEDLSCA